jgi:nitrogen fixation protein
MEPQLMSEPELRRAVKALAIQNSDKKVFIPESSLYALLSMDQIRKVISAYIPEHDVAETVDVAYNHGRKILAILIDIEHVPGITAFINNDIADDNRLPLTKDLIEAVLGSQEDACQWKVTAPAFARRTLWRHLPSDTILPIIRETYLGSGGFGDIFEICFEQSYQSFDGIARVSHKPHRPEMPPN